MSSSLVFTEAKPPCIWVSRPPISVSKLSLISTISRSRLSNRSFIPSAMPSVYSLTTGTVRRRVLQFGLQVQGFAGDHVDLLRVADAARFFNLDGVGARAQLHRLVLMRRARVSAIDEHPGILHLGVQLDFAGVGIRVVTAVHRAPIRPVITAVIRRTDHQEPADCGWRTHRRQCHQDSRQNQQSLFHFHYLCLGRSNYLAILQVSMLSLR